MVSAGFSREKADRTQHEKGTDMADKITVLLTQEQVEARIKEMGEEISRDYAGQSLHTICILKGGSLFMTQLTKNIDPAIPLSMDFMAVSSYGNEAQSGGVVRIIKDLDEAITGKNVIVVEDIIDTGWTLSYLMELLRERRPASLKLCTLLDKPDRREVEVKVDYVGFKIPDYFVVGYGLDYAQKHRTLPYIGVVETD